MQSVSDVAAAVRAAFERGEHVSVADLDLSGLDRILEHEAGDLTCTVEAGIRLSALQAALAEHGQMLALDPPGDPTIGACIAADLAGPRSFRYGRIRDLLLGVTAVFGDGLVASSGGKVVKNVAGYDLGKLLCGSRGTLGVIVRASLRLHPLPEASATLVVAAAEPEARAGLETVLAAGLVPSAADVAGGRLALLFEGSARAVESQLEAAAALVGGARAGDEIWDEVRSRPGRSASAEAGDPVLRSLLERIRAAFDPQGVFVAR